MFSQLIIFFYLSTCLGHVMKKFFEKLFGFSSSKKERNEIDLDRFLHSFNAQWDRALRMLMTKGEVIELTRYTIEIALEGISYSVWIGNKYSSYGNLYKKKIGDGEWIETPECVQYRPSRSTMLKLSLLVQDYKDIQHNEHYGNEDAKRYGALNKRKRASMGKNQ
ncbi:MAG: hypothetical protein ACRC2I_01070 [Plesiomonas shigelloides]